MKPPRKHHYLPEWYLTRWAKPWRGEDVVWEFQRVGPDQVLRTRYRHPAAAGYKEHLYTYPKRAPVDAARIETDFLQLIDDRGAKALAMAEENQAAGPRDKGGLVQFMLSMIHRSPERINFLHQRLMDDLADNPLFEGEGPDYFREGALDVFVDLVQSDLMLDRMMEMKTFVINLSDDAHNLLVSDCPLMMSNGLAHKDAFVLLPTGPRKLIMLADNPALPQHVVGHNGRVISKAMNDAVVTQAKKTVYASDDRQKRFIENRLNRPDRTLARAIDKTTGLVYWKI